MQQHEPKNILEEYPILLDIAFLICLSWIIIFMLPAPHRQHRRHRKCGICKKEFDSAHFKRHMKSHMKKSNKEETLIKCDICNSIYTESTSKFDLCHINDSRISNTTHLPPQVSNKSETIQPSTSKFEDEILNKKQKLEYYSGLDDIQIVTESIPNLLISNKQEEIRDKINLLTLKPWQQQIIDLMTPSNYNSRQILVVFDPVGGIGKTTIRKYLVQKPEWISINGYQINNLFEGYQKLIQHISQKNWNVIVDLPRTTKTTPCFIEQIKDGQYPAYSYHKKPLSIHNPNLIIFCNSLSVVNDLSVDRLKIFTIDSEEKLKEENIRFHKNKIELCTGTVSTNIFSHKRKTYCNKSLCLSNCIQCQKFICTACNKCKECNMCICKYTCDTCSLKFSTPFNLKRHMKSHTNTFNCNICKLPNFNETSLARHVTLYHQGVSISTTINTNPVINNNTFINYCKICKKSCGDLICEECIRVPTASKNVIKCKYCIIECDPTEMESHLVKYHIDRVIGYLYQFDVCM